MTLLRYRIHAGAGRANECKDGNVKGDAVIEWVEDWGPLITLSSTVVLAVITAVLVYLTKVMADSARTAATQSRIAAEASLASVAAAEAAVDVAFDVEPLMTTTVKEMEDASELLSAAGMGRDEVITPALWAKLLSWREVKLTCRGNTVSLHGLILSEVTTEEPATSGAASGIKMSVGTPHGLQLPTTEALPRLMHVGEAVIFDVPDRPAGEALEGFRASVLYAFGNGAIRRREVEWIGPPQFPGEPFDASSAPNESGPDGEEK
jgi:hypothetical protein